MAPVAMATFASGHLAHHCETTAGSSVALWTPFGVFGCFPGDGQLKINKKDLTDYFPLKQDQIAVLAPLKATETEKKMDIFINVGGG